MIHRTAFDFERMEVACWEGGEGPALLLVHGSGPGASTLGNWRLVLDDLAEDFHVMACDLVGFGESGRKAGGALFDIELWMRQLQACVERFPHSQVNVLGHSLSGYLALRLGATHPRVGKVMATGSMGVRFPLNEHLERVWSFPATREAILQTGASLVYDRSVLTQAYVEGRQAVLNRPGYGEYFNAMFAGDKQAYIDACVLTPQELSSLRCPTLLVHGRDDLPVPFEQAGLPLLRQLPHAEFVGLAHCGHSPALEHPRKLVSLAREFFTAT